MPRSAYDRLQAGDPLQVWVNPFAPEVVVADGQVLVRSWHMSRWYLLLDVGVPLVFVAGFVVCRRRLLALEGRRRQLLSERAEGTVHADT